MNLPSRALRWVASALVFAGALLLLSPLLVTWLITRVNEAAAARYLPTVYAHGHFETPPFKVWWGAPYQVAIGMNMDPSASCRETKTLEWNVISSSSLIKPMSIEPTLQWCPDWLEYPVWWATSGSFRARFGHTYRVRIEAPAWAPGLAQEPPRVMIQMPAEGRIAPGMLAVPGMLLGVMVGSCLIAVGLVVGQSVPWR